MRRAVIISAILLQVLALGWVVYERESVLRHGQVISLRTAPVDPRDVMRGDYVQLAYEINRVPRTLVDQDILQQDKGRERRVYAALSVDTNGMATVAGLHSEPPANGLYLRGYLTRDWRLDAAAAEVSVRFGIEKLFVEQGAGKLIEAQRGSRNDWQRPLDVAVAVGHNGIGVIRNHHWAPYSARLELLGGAENGEQLRRASPHVRFSIRNEASETLVLVNPGDNCGFSLQAVDGVPFDMLQPSCADVAVTPADVVVLARGETYAREFDLALPRWHIRRQPDNKPAESGEIGSLADRFQQYRLVYRSPTAGIALPSGAPAPWAGTVRSAAFNASGRVD